MLSKMGGRYVAYYADDLAAMLLDDILKDAAQDFNKIEQKSRKERASKEAEVLATDILTKIGSFKEEASHIDTRWGNI